MHLENATFRAKPFTTFLEDAVWCALEAERVSNQPNPENYVYIKENIGRLAKLSVLNLAFAAEAVANILIDSCDYPNQLSADVEKLNMLGKFDIYLISRGKDSFLDRGHPLTQALSELVKWRSLCVHPKVTQNSFHILTKKEHKKRFFPILKIPKENNLLRWNEKMPIPIMQKCFEFFTHYLLGWCGHQPLEMRSLLFHEIIDSDGKIIHAHFQYSKHLMEGVDKWNLDDRFFCRYASHTKFVDGYELVYEPGYPEDRLIRKTPRKHK